MPTLEKSKSGLMMFAEALTAEPVKIKVESALRWNFIDEFWFRIPGLSLEDL